ncbi:uncharacterized protein [Nicotiana tomentosiformis]|uniref:uncharacterized protein n=1 Tax=Nicotiana tomentosiformis TaxID=4098 RepID=UPI00388C3C85
MTCVQSVTYTIMLNGSPIQPFEARKGLRQGDPLSPFLFVLAMEYFIRRLKALHHIPDFNYHPKCAKMQIMQLGFAGLEINKKKSSIFFGGVSQDMPVDILEFLGIQKGELPIFMMPKKITKLIEAICRSFLWTGNNNISKKALLAWEKNKAAVSKQFWNLCKEKNKLWIQWVHCYYIKNKHIWEVQLNQASWIMRKIVKAKENFEASGYNYEDLRQMHDCSIKHIYHKLLYTKDRLLKWGIQTDQTCLLCTQANESIQHLFFECQYAAELWKMMLKWQGISRNIYGWSEELKWAENWTRSRNAKSELFKMVLAECVYFVWQERNARLFQDKARNWEIIGKLIVQEVHCRSNKEVGKALSKLDYNPM